MKHNSEWANHMENHKHRIPITIAQIIQFRGHTAFMNVLCCSGGRKGRGADAGFGGPAEDSPKVPVCLWCFLVSISGGVGRLVPVVMV
jgi:hypothetical protein